VGRIENTFLKGKEAHLDDHVTEEYMRLMALAKNGLLILS
jgi:hypothetical protein